MENLLFLACPLGMGLMMWLMMRANRTPGGTSTSAPMNEATVPASAQPAAGSVGSRWMPHLCLNWKVVAGLAIVGLGVWIALPSLASTALPLLLLAACPLSMLFMARGMHGDQAASTTLPIEQTERSLPTPEERIAQLKTRQAGVLEEQRAIENEIARLKADDSTAEGTANRTNAQLVNGPA